MLDGAIQIMGMALVLRLEAHQKVLKGGITSGTLMREVIYRLTENWTSKKMEIITSCRGLITEK